MALLDIYLTINLYFTPIIIIFGVVGNILNVLIFSRPSLRRSCSIYFLAGGVNGLVVLLFGAMTRWLSDGFTGLDATRFSLGFCRFRPYLAFVVYNLAPYFTACITIDRFCSSSANANIRRLSAHVRVAYGVLPIVVVSTAVAYAHMLAYFSIINSVCQPDPGFYAQFFPFFTAAYYFMAIAVIIIFGLGTSYNIRTQHRRVRPTATTQTVADRRRIRGDAQILLMLFVHIACYACLALPYHISLIVAATWPKLSTNPTFAFVEHMAIVTLNLSQAINFYVYTLAASLYRKELMALVRRITGWPIAPTIRPASIHTKRTVGTRR